MIASESGAESVLFHAAPARASAAPRPKPAAAPAAAPPRHAPQPQAAPQYAAPPPAPAGKCSLSCQYAGYDCAWLADMHGQMHTAVAFECFWVVLKPLIIPVCCLVDLFLPRPNLRNVWLFCSALSPSTGHAAAELWRWWLPFRPHGQCRYR